MSKELDNSCSENEDCEDKKNNEVEKIKKIKAGLDDEQSINKISEVTEEKEFAKIKQDEFVNLQSQRVRKQENKDNEDWNKKYNLVIQVCNNQLVMKFIALAKEVGMVLKDGVGREMNVQNLGEIGKSWSEDASEKSAQKFAHVAYFSWGENPGWEIAMEKIVMQELKFKYDEEGFDHKKNHVFSKC